MFFKNVLYAWISALSVVVIVSCASPKSPTGGPRDESPPAIIEASSTPNQQVHFKGKEIIITFDEWITLKDVYRQLVISPLMPKEPEIKQKGKSIIITLPDSLRKETTYTIHFGNAIQDLNEGNILENYAFVFSTGAVLDSIKLSGLVTDAINLKPAEGIWVMLHPAGEDSAVYKRKPEYLAKTNKEGQWHIANIRADSFRIVALKDENLNFLYDQEAELFGWQEETVYMSSPAAVIPEIRIFPKEKRISIREILHAVPGWIKIIVDAPYPKPTPQLFPPVENAFTAWNGDTLHIWYPPENNYSGWAVLESDSTRIRASTGRSLMTSSLPVIATTGRLHPGGLARFVTEVPIASIDTFRIIMTHDSLGMISFTLARDSAQGRGIEIKSAWNETTRYLLTFLPGAITDIWGRTHDTIRQFIVVNSREQFGDLTLNIEGLDSTRQYLIFIKSGEQILERFVIDQLSTAQLKKSAMSPGKYGIEVIADENRNGVWDTGNYQAHRQPEKKRIFTLDNLRAGWELETNLTWK